MHNSQFMQTFQSRPQFFCKSTARNLAGKFFNNISLSQFFERNVRVISKRKKQLPPRIKRRKQHSLINFLNDALC